ncbi:MAG: hypothetical protein A2W61_02030 [Deltaproteobacteria bacterium RIFCSPLOWO2_01_44_7]|nr:MAG: hypothetical protein A2712_01685 [Deltaproteobacteria bacterium RIFCSPHIGHO2_01_FULL_43_49]OGQ15161.1 MAG: hypothetical protein A3D22_03790 [Deltaproteobacteria bacterium RIFCSPHIGHO2_02_FULL_44_53]OGQ27218.1 MAG: hypothetical protein A3D98_02280 [Deltaproteobacteria bacterium RIFCSPHIGHO2_12_FULL_44_21]OGQ31678.1 MAG: hypothetical protein A2979_04950 [Deltaproteobacteria bacterium RIFCSPLOWO2_01_FULL_45_74]OGQ38551.1 MAG: hypothetical protein A2W61_02030 [Deltaproteobacteria bacterium 
MKPRQFIVKPNEKRRKRTRSQRFLNILFEDRDIIVVNKPAGVLTEPKEGSPHEHVLGMIKGYLQRKFKESKGSYVKLLHRLDRDTTGVLVAAKSKIGEQIEDQFRSHSIDRQYIAIVEGRVENEDGQINFPLEKGEFGWGKKVRVSKQGAKALTRYHVQERYENATLLSIQVATGRTHQVRIHCAEIGHPLVGDKIYGASGTIPFPRHALHASVLGFRHPKTGNKQRFEAKLPEDMEALVDRLRGE